MRAHALAALALALTFVLAGCSSNEATYPHSYLLDEDELPSTLRLSEMGDEFPMENPGRVPDFAVQAMVEEFGDASPQEVWAEFVEPVQDTGGLMIAAGFWATEADADAAIAFIKSESEGEVCDPEDGAGTILQDKQVIVVVGGDTEMQKYLGSVISALKSDAPGLADRC